MSSNDSHLIVVGVVAAAVHEVYSVQTPEKVLKASLAGKLRFNKIQILENDVVEVRLSPYDLENGQIVRRLKPDQVRALKPEVREALGIRVK